MHFDGACQPPHGGVAGYGFTIEGAFEHEEGALAVRPGAPHASNNVAEYAGAIAALEWLARQGYRGPVLVRGDSQLVLRQMEGRYRVRADHLKAYHAQLSDLVRRFSEVRFEWISRSANARADALSKRAIEREGRVGPGPRARSEGAERVRD